MKKEKNLLKELIIAIIAAVISCIAEGFVLMKASQWIITPCFSVKPINLVTSIGIISIVSYMKLDLTKEDERTLGEKFWMSLLSDALFLLIFFIISLFI